MGLHSATWRIHASGVDDLNLLKESLRWLAGNGCEFTIDKGKSWHGSPQTIMQARVSKKKAAEESLARLGEAALTCLIKEGIAKRIDAEKVMHVRVELSKLVQGEVRLAADGHTGATAKGQFKIEVYPGSEPAGVMDGTIRSMLGIE